MKYLYIACNLYIDPYLQYSSSYLDLSLPSSQLQVLFSPLPPSSKLPSSPPLCRSPNHALCFNCTVLPCSYKAFMGEGEGTCNRRRLYHLACISADALSTRIQFLLQHHYPFSLLNCCIDPLFFSFAAFPLFQCIPNFLGQWLP